MNPDLFAPYIQYGFAGFAFLLLACLMWLTRKILGVIERNTAVIARHDSSAADRSATQIRYLDRIESGLDEHRQAMEGAK